MIDNKTSRLQLPLPNVENYLEEDVERLSEALTTLDGVVATIAEDGKLVQDQVPDYVARLDTEGKLPSDNLPVSAVQTNGEGKIPESVIPDEIARDSEVLAKGANLSDLADRAAAWLNVRPVGSTPLAGDPVGDYDAATKRWVQNLLNTGSVGPTMNGVMNFGVGDFHLRDSRAYIQPYEVTSDGQLLNRADWPELWAYAQMLSPITDAAWLADPLQRSQYSTGNGSTTFRVPDRNGVQPGSLKGLFGRGSGDFTQKMHESAAPNITGSFGRLVYASTGSVYESNTGAGAFSPFSPQAKYKRMSDVASLEGSAATYPSGYDFAASNSSPVYGRQNVSEIRPNSFVGVWVIRASGGFVAANTSWSVINADASMPSAGTTVDGGEIVSRYNVGTVTEAQMSWRMRAAIGANYYARLNVSNSTTGKTAVYDFNENGDFSTNGSVSCAGTLTAQASIVSRNTGYPGLHLVSNRYNTPNTNIGALTLLECTGTDGTVSNVNLIRRRGDGNQAGQITVTFPITTGTLALQGTSGLQYKKEIKDADAKEAFDRIANQRLVNFVYNDDEQERVRFGIIAEEAEVIAPQYIKHIQEPYEDILDEDGNKVGEKTRDRPSVDNNPIVMDLMGAVQYLKAEIEDLKAQIAELKA